MYKELDKLVEKAKEGDIDSKEEILNRLEGLIINSIKRYYNNKNQYKDLTQEGRLLILESINNYDEDKGVYFLGYIKTILRYHYLDYHKKKQTLSLNIIVGENQEDELINILESDEPNPLEEYIQLEEISQLEEALSILTKRQRDIIIYFYYKNMSIKDIAEKLGVSYRTVVNTKTRALELLKEYHGH